MLLYRYFASHAFETLRDAELKTSLISSFNDPFEFMFRVEGEMTREKATTYIQKRLQSPAFIAQIRAALPPGVDLVSHVNASFPAMVDALISNHAKISRKHILERESLADRNIRIISFSAADASQTDEILMWSHYANMHRGVRIGFEFPEAITYPFKIVPVDYRLDRVPIDFSIDPTSDIVQEALRQSISGKSKAWCYEREHRLLTLPNCCVTRKIGSQDMDFISIERAWVKRVDFGTRCPQSEVVRIASLVTESYQHVLLRRAEYHPSDYSLVYQDIDDTASLAK